MDKVDPARCDRLDASVRTRKPVSRQPVCKHCGSYACANGGSNGSGYWISDPGCDAARADRGLPPWKNPLDSEPSADAALKDAEANGGMNPGESHDE